MGFSGMDKAKKRLSALEYKAQLMAAKTMQEWLILIGTEAAVMTPIDTSTLLNSQYKSQSSGSESIMGKIGYSANYAYYVHDTKYPMKFKRATAEKEFLLKAITQTSDERMNILRKNIKAMR